MTTMTAADPAGTAQMVAPDAESRVDRDSHFNGLYETRQNLRIEGLAEGEIRCEGTLTVAEGRALRRRSRRAPLRLRAS